MSKPVIARYSFQSGLPGCMPDYSDCAEFTSRAHLASAIKADLELLGYPASLFRQVKIRKLWGFIKRHGASSAHVTLYHGGRAFCLYGLTEDEYRAQCEDN